MPKVSVIIPTYNRAGYIEEAIDSVLAQTYKDFEIIVIDDGSTDKTRKVLRKYTGQIRYFPQENQGVAVSRNKGIAVSRGEYVAFLDSDDAWLPKKLERQVAFLEEHPDIALVCGEVFLMDEKGETIHHVPHDRELPLTFKNLFEQSLIHVPTTMVRRQILEEAGGFDPAVDTSEDYDLWLRIIKKHRGHYMELPLAKYRLHQDSLMSNLERRLSNNLMIFRKKEITAGMSWLKKRIRLAKVYYEYAQEFLKIKSFHKAGRAFFKALVHCPWIGAYDWPPECSKMRFSLPYRVLNVYGLALHCLRKMVQKN